ncbi:achaete-scute transcription factor-related protein [Artemisia annua]|uniref:Achaete-scute transcription factor-related protein n=1 Tax=Artemisia annua TaxID=35608 RepID=A0A2U1P4Q5_ARTAN|nr:achaete-scute transcription factor-related protein [Artemisia annua]
MEGSIKCSASDLKKPERKIIEKNRRNQMKSLYSNLFSLIPPNIFSKDGDVSDRVDRAIEYIQMSKTNLDMLKNKKEKLSSRKRSHEHTKIIKNVCKPVDIQIHEISHDIDAVMVTGLDNHSSFCDVVWLLNRYSAEVTLATFSSNGHSTFNIRQKKIEGKDICKRLKTLLEGSLNVKELENNHALLTLPQPGLDTGIESGPQRIEESQINLQKELNELEYDSNLSIWDLDFQSNVWITCNELDYESNLSIWDFDFHPNVWGSELEVFQ